MKQNLAQNDHDVDDDDDGDEDDDDENDNDDDKDDNSQRYGSLETSVRPTAWTGCSPIPASPLVLRKWDTSGLFPKRLKPTRSKSGPGPISCDCEQISK